MNLQWKFFGTEKVPVNRNWGLSTFDLKCLALLTMTIDHIGAFIIVDQNWLRIVGRMSFPIFCFLIVEGYLRTRNVYKYMIRLLAFAFISEVPYDLARGDVFFNWSHQNVYFTLFFGLVCIFAMDRFRLKWQSPIIILVSCVSAHFSHCDYAVAGVLMIMGYYIFYNNWIVKYAFEGLINFLAFSSIIQGAAVVAFIPMSFYSGKKGPSSKIWQYFFYVYYPLHLFLIYLFRTNIQELVYR